MEDNAIIDLYFKRSEQAIVETDTKYGGYCYSMKNGQVKQLASGQDVMLCEGNILAVTRSYLDGNKTYGYYRIVDGNAVLVDYLRYDKDKNLDNPWMRSNDNSGQDYSMSDISEAEFESIRRKYVPIDFQMKPVSEYA